MNQPANKITPGSTRTGIFSGISNADYHADTSTYSSSLIKLMDVPALAKHYMDNPGKYKECYRIGTAIHKYILERNEFEDEFLIGIPCARRSGADKDEWAQWFYQHGANGSSIVMNKAAEWNWLFELETGKHMVTPAEIEMIEAMARSVMANDNARKLLEGGEAEQSVYWTDEETGLNLRCRPDYLSRFISDLKSCQSARPGAVARETFQRGYHIQQAMYQDGIRQITGEHRPFLFIFVEKTPPYLCAVYGLDNAAAELGYNTYRSRLRRLAECLETGEWPGIEDELQLALPRYAFD